MSAAHSIAEGTGADVTQVPSVHEHDVEKTSVKGSHASGSEKEGAVAATPSPEDDGYAHGMNLFFVILGGALYVFLVALDSTIVSTAIPEVTNQFNSFSDVGWYGSAYLLTSTATQPLFGRLYTDFNVKYVYLIALFIFELGSLICGVAKDSPTFIAGRAVAGLGFAGGYSGTMVLINMAMPVNVRAGVLGLIAGVYGVGGVIGPLIGGAFTTHATWRWCFYINLIFYPFVGFTILFFLHLPKIERSKSITKRLITIDWHGSALLLASVVCILLACQWGGIKYNWSNSVPIGLIIGFVVIGAVFWVDQWFMGENALIPLRIMRNRDVFFGGITALGIGSTYFQVLYYLPIYFQSVRGSSAIRSGVQTLPLVLAWIFFTVFIGGLTQKTRYYMPPLIIGSAIMAIASGMFTFLTVDAPQPRWIGLEFLLGASFGTALTMPLLAMSACLTPADITIGTTFVAFTQTLGATIFVSVAQALFQNKFVIYLRQIPGVDVNNIVDHGVSAFRQNTPPELLPAVIYAANRAIGKIWYSATVLGALTFIACFGMSLNKRTPKPGEEPGNGAMMAAA